jgi:hypothetical protein
MRDSLCSRRVDHKSKTHRSVEAVNSVPSLGTGDGGSQWCNRLPEIVMTSVAGFMCWEEPWPRKAMSAKVFAAVATVGTKGALMLRGDRGFYNQRSRLNGDDESD